MRNLLICSVCGLVLIAAPIGWVIIFALTFAGEAWTWVTRRVLREPLRRRRKLGASVSAGADCASKNGRPSARSAPRQ
jgi:hypothetical protein